MTTSHQPVTRTGELRPAFATLLGVAKRAAQRDQPTEDDALVAILFAAFGVEAWLNDLLYGIRAVPHERLPDSLQGLKSLIRAANLEERSTSLRTRLNVIGCVLSGPNWTLGHQPFQDFDLLIDIRNTLAHQRPETFTGPIIELPDGTYEFGPNKLAPIAERLVARGVGKRPEPATITSLHEILQQPQVGRWAYETALAVIENMISLIPEDRWRVKMLKSLRPLSMAAQQTEPPKRQL